MRSLAVYLKNYKKESILAPFFKFLDACIQAHACYIDHRKNQDHI